MCARWWLKFMFGLVVACGAKGHHEHSGFKQSPLVLFHRSAGGLWQALSRRICLHSPSVCLQISVPLSLHYSWCCPGTLLVSSYPHNFPSQKSESAWLMFRISLTSSSVVSWSKPSTSTDLGWHHWAYFKLGWLLGCIGEIFAFLLIIFSFIL